MRSQEVDCSIRNGRGMVFVAELLRSSPGSPLVFDDPSGVARNRDKLQYERVTNARAARVASSVMVDV